MAEGTPLLRERRSKADRGFDSRPLRKTPHEAPNGASLGFVGLVFGQDRARGGSASARARPDPTATKIVPHALRPRRAESRSARVTSGSPVRRAACFRRHTRARSRCRRRIRPGARRASPRSCSGRPSPETPPFLDHARPCRTAPRSESRPPALTTSRARSALPRRRGGSRDPTGDVVRRPPCHLVAAFEFALSAPLSRRQAERPEIRRGTSAPESVIVLNR